MSLWVALLGSAVTGAVMYRFGYRDGKMTGFKLGLRAKVPTTSTDLPPEIVRAVDEAYEAWLAKLPETERVRPPWQRGDEL